ncbi:MAG: exodeoxyribonuclease I [Methylomonas sp.]
MTASFYWHDYETFGADPLRDRVSQFAGVRTDTDFNIIGEPLTLYCRPAPDYLPQPEACLITGITPQTAARLGVCEADFIRAVHDQLARPGTCALGYNSVRFDDEVTRNLLYRNFYDPYAREWQNQNSRWDIIDVARAAYALRPDGINWPLNDDGSACFKLEALTQANGISHQSAHDALSDVYATIGLARLIRDRQPRLYRFLFENRSKAAARELLKLGSFTPLVHISGRFPARKNCLAIVAPLFLHPRNNNETVVYDLSADPAPLLTLSAEEIRRRLFVAKEALPEGEERIPLKTVHINKCPVLAPLSVISETDAERLRINLPQCLEHLQRIKTAEPLQQKLAEVYKTEYSETPSDPDFMIYSGGFFNDRDRELFLKIRTAKPDELRDFALGFTDPRPPELLFRYRARNYPETLSAAEARNWLEFRRSRLLQENGKTQTFSDFFGKITQLQTELGAEHPLLVQLQEYGVSLQKQLEIE